MAKKAVKKKLEKKKSKASSKKADEKKKSVTKKSKKSKGEKPSKKKAAGKKTPTKKTEVKRDKFGFKEGSITSKAAEMFNRDNGATTAEIKKAFGSAQLNLLKTVKEKGFKVSTEKIKPKKGGRTVTRYIISGKAKK